MSPRATWDRRRRSLVRRQIFSDTWTVLSVRSNNKAPEVLTTPGASFLVAGEGFASELRSLAQRSEASSRTPDLRVMRKFQGLRKEPKQRIVTDLRDFRVEPDGVLCAEVKRRSTPGPVRVEQRRECRWASPWVLGLALNRAWTAPRTDLPPAPLCAVPLLCARV